MKKTLQHSAEINLAAVEAGKPRRFRIVAYTGGPLSIDGWDLPVVVDLQGLQASAVPILLDHKKSTETTLGSVDEVQNDGRTLVLAGPVTGVSEPVLNVLRAADRGQQWQASIGWIIDSYVDIPAGHTKFVNGREQAGPFTHAITSTLKETSVLPSGADSATSVNLAAKAAALLKGSAMKTFEEWCAEMGIDPTKLTEAGKAFAMQQYDAAMKPAAPPAAGPPAAAAATPPAAPAAAVAGAKVDLTADLQQQLQAGQKLIASTLRKNAEIQAKAAGHPLIAAKAIEEGWSLEKVELEVLKASATSGTRPTSFRASEKDLPQDAVLCAAMCITRNTKDYEKHFKPEVLQAAHSEFRRGVGLQQIIIRAAQANGFQIAAGDRITTANINEILEAACPTRRELQAGFSTVSLPGILSNVANKELLTGYMEEDSAWKEIAKVKSVSDFKQVTSYRMLSDMTYELVPPGGEIKHGKVSEESYTRQVKTYGKMFVLTREDIINDDLGAFDGLRDEIGRGAAKKLNEIFWTAFINNGSFFTTARTNYIEGATTTLLTDGVGLGLAVKQFRKMTSPSADGLKHVGAGLRPEILLVPPELEVAAEILHKNTNLAAVKASDANIYANKYRPVVVWQLSDSNYTGYSTTAWYLLTNPNSMPTMVTSFLNGQQNPTVENGDVEFNRLGVSIRAYHDWGCDQAEYLGGLKSKGAA